MLKVVPRISDFSDDPRCSNAKLLQELGLPTNAKLVSPNTERQQHLVNLGIDCSLGISEGID